MKAVGIKNLKARLSEYVRMVRAGETILVTDRDEVIAELRPANRQALPPTSIESALQQWADCGEATLRSIDNKDWEPPFLSDGPFPTTSQQLLDDLRADRE